MNRYKATIILVMATIGFLISYPFHETFIGGLVSSGFCASMIGGFADWYGITALFRKPFGVSFKTEIIPKNREKIFDGLSNMVSDELLTKEHLKKLLNEYDTSKLILKYAANNKEYENIKKIISSIIQESFAGIHNDEVSKIAANLIAQNISQFNLWKALISAIEISIKNGYDEKIINFIIDESISYIKTDNFHRILTEIVEETKNSYENGMRKRIILNVVVLDMLLKLSSGNIAKVIQEKIENYFYNFKDVDNSDRLKLKEWIDIKFMELKQNNHIRGKLEEWKVQQINNLRIEEYIKIFFQNLKDKGMEEEGIIKKFIYETELKIQDIRNKFNNNIEFQKNVDNYVKNVAAQLIDSGHKNIGKIVRENLNKYSNDMLIELIESKAGNDLQLVRINGSIIGGLVGIIVFILTYKI
ncbi:DUF445 domain-containing protein [Clostridiaceae bacterium UIB06]|uniref:DUF445 domain-containing protein n=1 Tax=Clostridium thailandense TaxID=2794346 RepID=A0A949TST2_9CLOT|nr:DUF445 domain-containing protein [Clostridium thailandense]MBV7271673.1 DUF445 domain-containing protein [Clostridium thailandense]MCH5136356.1 DUF445 domain-containing protein [Clostridiaceae bacterium UIB06]